MNLNDEKTLRSLDLPMPQAYDMAREIIGQMRPVDSIFWIASGAPHDLVRFEGPTVFGGDLRGQRPAVGRQPPVLQLVMQIRRHVGRQVS